MSNQTSAKQTKAENNATKQSDGRKCRQTLSPKQQDALKATGRTTSRTTSIGNDFMLNLGFKQYLDSVCLSLSEISKI